jgi:hypothetical protein
MPYNVDLIVITGRIFLENLTSDFGVEEIVG